ncbi:hypothetical protein ACS0TY_006871 [Phlomoides rotata]
MLKKIVGNQKSSPESLDCGVVVCVQIETILLRKPKNKAADYRARMVKWFVNAPAVVLDPNSI